MGWEIENDAFEQNKVHGDVNETTGDVMGVEVDNEMTEHYTSMK